MKRFTIEQGNFILTPTAGLGLIGALINKHTKLDEVDKKIKQRHGVKHADIIKTYLGLLTQGKSDFEAAANLKEDYFFQNALGIKKMPSPERLRQRMDENAVNYEEEILKANVDFLVNAKPKISEMQSGHVAVDVDNTLFDNSNSNKEGVSATYKKFFGYAPILGYLGEEGYCVAFELRPGKQHCQNGTRETLSRIVERAKQIVPKGNLLFRLDGAYDATENFIELIEAKKQHAAGIDFIIKWNPRTNLTTKDKEYWLKKAISKGAWTRKEEGFREAIFEVQEGRFIKNTKFGGVYRRVMRVREFTQDENGQVLLIPDITIEGWWTTVNMPCEQVIEIYDQRGTSEQFHSEFKTDLDIERLPSGKFATNSLVVTCAMLAYNMLRWIGQKGLVGRKAPLRNPAKRRRIKTIMQHLMYLAAQIIQSGRRLKIKFGRGDFMFSIFEKVYYQISYG